MKRTLLTLLATATLAAAAPALAQPPWMSINQRQAELDSRIDAGVRDGSLTRSEAAGLRTEFNTLARLEATYRASPPGFTPDERRDLDRRFDQLSARIHDERSDRDRRGPGGPGRPPEWRSIADRRADLDARIDRSQADHRISFRDARNLHRDLADLARREAQYRASRPGLTPPEREDLDHRLDAIAQQLHEDRDDHRGDYRDHDRR